MENKTLKFWKVFAIILLALNITVILYLFTGNIGNACRFRGQKESPGNYLSKKLEFTDHQKAEFEKLRTDHHMNMMKLHAEGMELRKKFYDYLKEDKGLKNKSDSLVDLIAANQKQIELITYDHFARIRELCTPGQKIIFDDIFQELISHICRPPHRGPGPFRNN